MDQQNQEFGLRFRSKLSILFLFAFVGIPMLYTAYLGYQAQELFLALLMVVLFLTWAIVIMIAIGFKIIITDSSIQREGLFSPNTIEFSEIDAIHFGSTWSNFYIEGRDKKIYFGKDFENYEDIFRSIIERVRSNQSLEEITFRGDPENIEKHTAFI